MVAERRTGPIRVRARSRLQPAVAGRRARNAGDARTWSGWAATAPWATARGRSLTLLPERPRTAQARPLPDQCRSGLTRWRRLYAPARRC